MAVQTANAAATRTIMIAIVGGVAIFTLPTVMLLGIGMMPTFVAMLTDRRKEKYATLCVGGMNFTGVLPFMIILCAVERGSLAPREDAASTEGKHRFRVR